MLNYLLPITTAFLALLYLLKDWDAHRKSWRRVAVLCVIIAIGIGGTVNNYYAEKRYQLDQEKIAGLQKAVETANKNQEDNTKQFVDAFGKLSQKVADLQTEVSTAGLQKTADQLKAELAATQKALIQPKAILAFTFAKSWIDLPAIRKVTLPVKNDIVHVEFTVMNETDTTALDGELTIIICDDCKFASEPPLFVKLPGQRDTHRILKFDRIFAKTELKILSADIQVPSHIDAIEFGVVYRCKNCIIPEPKANAGIIVLDRKG